AIGIKELLKQHVRIPEDIKVVCFDKNEAFDFMPFQIPYVQQPIQEMSRKSVDILMEQIKQSSAIPTTMEMFASMSNKS
ncbi:MAG: substrate-binding domain-containing protein, partial [Massilibacteroides sp.]|nr:substrate-binding domain-containing protein [Massilibacteroides sp.]